MDVSNEYLQALDAIADGVAGATHQEDWERLRLLDNSARQHMEAASQAAQSGKLSVDEVIERLDRLQTLFESARAAAVKSRDEASAALKATGRTHQAAQAYLSNTRK